MLAQVLRKDVSYCRRIRYLLHLPPRRERSARWPLILFLHGSGERGDDLNLVKKHGLPKVLASQPEFPFVVVAPQCSPDSYWHYELETLDVLLNDVLEAYPVDSRRLYLTGLSMGGYGTWAMAIRYPDRFAAIAPVCGGGVPFTTERIRHLPVWAFHGAQDDVVPVRESQDMVDALNHLYGGNAKLTIYPDAKHDSWTETYANPQLYDWFLSQHQNRR